MTKEQIKEVWTPLINVQFHQIEKGIDQDGWYSNDRNDAWLPMAALKNIGHFRFRNANTELRPKYLDEL